MVRADYPTTPQRHRPRIGPPRPARLASDELPPLDLTIPPWPAREIQLRSASIVVRDTPSSAADAEPALYVHGLGGSSTNWTDLAAQLRPWLSGAAIDLPGFGGSAPSRNGGYSLGTHADAVVAYLEQSGRGPVHLLGNSMGGAVAIVAASARPDLVRTLTLISPAVPDLRPQRAVRDPYLGLAALPGVGAVALRRLERFGPERRALGVIELCFGDPSVVPPNRLAEAVAEVERRMSMAWSTDAFVRSLRGLIAAYFVPGARSLWARLATIRVPSLVVWGDRDRLVDVALAPRVARTLPYGRLLVLPGVGHVAQMEQPVTTARAVLGLLQDGRGLPG
jgi:pimeloyl-ACP methyl ester carboxylesterase